MFRRFTLHRVRRSAVVVLALTVSSSFAEATEIQAYGRDLFRQGGRAINRNQYAEAQALFERSLAYTGQRNALWNLTACHLAQGHRDLAVAFLERYMVMYPPYQESSEMQALVGVIADEPPNIPNIARRYEIWEDLATAIDEAMGVTPTITDEAGS